MSEYIEREAILNKSFCMAPATMINPYGGEAVVSVEDIENIPAADVEPVRHGRWEECDWMEYDGHSEHIRYPKAALRCSACYNAFKKVLLWKDNYCPNCGAKMDLEE